VLEPQWQRGVQRLGDQAGGATDQQRAEGQAELVHQAGLQQARQQPRTAFAEQPLQPALGELPDGVGEVDRVVAGHHHVGEALASFARRRR
jgi:hypothetical protein